MRGELQIPKLSDRQALRSVLASATALLLGTNSTNTEGETIYPSVKLSGVKERLQRGGCPAQRQEPMVLLVFCLGMPTAVNHLWARLYLGETHDSSW